MSNLPTAALYACTMFHIRDPETEKMGWLVKCYGGAKIEYTQPAFIKSKRGAKEVALRWLASYRPKFTISVDELRLEHKK